jgi:hypothetical protein
MAKALVTLLSLVFTACTTLQPLPDAQPATLRQAVAVGDKVEIDRVDGTHLTLTVEEITDDYLIGKDAQYRHRVALPSVRTIAVRTMTTRDKVWTAVGVAAGVGAIIAIASGGGSSGGGGSGDPGGGY